MNKKNSANLVPGPGSYEMSLHRPQSGTKIGKADRSKCNDNNGPGPGAYEFTYKGKSSN